MIGFVNSRREARGLGGEVFRARQKKYKIFMGILGVVGFTLLNIILYMMTKINL
jgi:hypothetical protein